MNTRRVRALIPAAGRGSRLSGLGESPHKELLRVGPLTMIEHAVGMVLDSGVRELAVVIRPDKEEIRDCVERFCALRSPVPERLEFIYQAEPLGLGQAMGLGADFAGDLPLAVVLPDNLLIGGPPALGRMLTGFEQTGNNIPGVIALPPEQAGLFGNVGRLKLAATHPGRPVEILDFSPKAPGVLEDSGSGPLYKGFSGTIYLPGWQERIARLRPNFQGELDDTDLVTDLVREGRMMAVLLEGTGFDLGQPQGLAAARAYWAETRRRND